ncbi:MAG: tRNA (adenosine(37)-N6)-threonylcarbamoyltransferase complex dimerization subunit type 1 TsaB [Candidatus Firestonebacteria bacterium]
MKVLGVETSTSVNSVALIDEDKVLCELSMDTGLTHSSYLMSNIDLILKFTSMKISDIDGLAISSGPGSFTGLRVGFSLIKGLGFALNKPVVGVPTLDALAYRYSLVKDKVKYRFNINKNIDTLICPMIDAKKNEIYFSLYSNFENSFVKLTKEKSLPVEDAVIFIKKYKFNFIVFLGDGSIKYLKVLEKRFKNFSLTPTSSKFPKADTVAELGLMKIKNNEIDKFNELLPFYLRKPDALLRKK